MAGYLPRGVFNQETSVPQTFTLTPEQLEAFDRLGVVRLPGFYPEADIEPMADRLWADLELRFGMVWDRPDSWTVASPAHFQALTRAGAFSALGSPRMSDLADGLLGAGAWDAPRPWGWPLVTFPSLTPNMRRPPWHLDIGGLLLKPTARPESFHLSGTSAAQWRRDSVCVGVASVGAGDRARTRGAGALGGRPRTPEDRTPLVRPPARRRQRP